MNRKKLPIGVQTFSEIRRENYYYVDKTHFLLDAATLRTTWIRSLLRSLTGLTGRRSGAGIMVIAGPAKRFIILLIFYCSLLKKICILLVRDRHAHLSGQFTDGAGRIHTGS